jgi:hypothetical protein
MGAIADLLDSSISAYLAGDAETGFRQLINLRVPVSSANLVAVMAGIDCGITS